MSSAPITATWNAEIDDGSQAEYCLTIQIGVTFEGSRPRSWQLELSYDRYPNKHFSRKDLSPDDSVDLHEEYEDGVTVIGAISCHFSPGSGCYFDTNHLTYGFPDKLQNLLGNVVSILSIPLVPIVPVPDPPPQPVSDDDDSIPELEISSASTRRGELFPYVYMRIWPQPSADALTDNFVRYPYAFDSLPTGQFLITLARLRASGAPDARQAMETLAVRYAEGQGDTQLPFVRDVMALPQPVGSYPEVFRFIREEREAPPHTVLEAVASMLGLTLLALREFIASEQATELRVRLYQSYFALVISYGYASKLRTRLAQCLVVDHLLWCALELTDRPLTSGSLRELVDASLALPQAVFPLPPAKAEPGVSTTAIVPYAIGELHLVRQRLARYAFGEIAYIESVMPGERRKSLRRQATRTNRSFARADVREHGHETRNGSSSLRREVSSVLADVIATTTYPDSGFSINYGTPTTLTGGWKQELKPAQSEDGPSRSASLRDVREIVERAATRTAIRVAEARTESTLHESEHASESVHDNRGGRSARRGVYRWLNEVHLAEVVCYGNRFVLEFTLYKPGKAYLRDASGSSRGAFPPVPPRALGLYTFADLRPERFAELCACFPKAQLEPPPAPRRSVTALVRSGEALTLPLPAGYRAAAAMLGAVLGPKAPPLSVRGVLGSTSFDISVTETSVTRVELKGDCTLLAGLVQIFSTAAHAVDSSERQLTLEIELAASERHLDEWRAHTFQAVQRAYQAEYAAFSSASERKDETYPAVRHDSSEVIRSELKRGALELLWRSVEALGGAPPAPDVGSASETALPRYLQFFEHAFEWHELSYSLLAAPSQSSIRSVDGDVGRRFPAFLEAEFAQLLLPVKPSLALSVLYLLASGTLWDEGRDDVPVHECNQALACELKELKDTSTERVVTSEPWEVIVPTTLTVLANDNLEKSQ